MPSSTSTPQLNQPERQDSYLTSYFKETTVHGFRYVVEGRNFAEKTIWVLTIILAFIISTYMAMTSMREARENPISTSIEIKSIDKVPFPAVTVLAGGGEEADMSYRLIADILNTVKFDCSRMTKDEKDGVKCLNDTLEVRRVIRPLMLNTVKSVYEGYKKLVSIGEASVYFGEWPFSWEKIFGVPTHYTLKLAKTFCKLSGQLPPNWSEDGMLDMLTENFYVPFPIYESKTLKYIETLQLDTHPKEKANSSTMCEWNDFGTVEIKAMFHTIILLSKKVYSRNDKRLVGK